MLKFSFVGLGKDLPTHPPTYSAHFWDQWLDNIDWMYSSKFQWVRLYIMGFRSLITVCDIVWNWKKQWTHFTVPNLKIKWAVVYSLNLLMGRRVVQSFCCAIAEVRHTNADSAWFNSSIRHKHQNSICFLFLIRLDRTIHVLAICCCHDSLASQPNTPSM